MSGNGKKKQLFLFIHYSPFITIEKKQMFLFKVCRKMCVYVVFNLDCRSKSIWHLKFFFVIHKSTVASQLAHDVVATLGFGYILVATSDNVVTTLPQHCVADVITTTKNIVNVVTMSCFRRRFSDLTLTLQQRRDPDVVFLTKF